ncbi:serine hydrolase domain-containing protein [Actinomarinicola tropica]|uniref:Serine hydrolase n=1 Tax=Actinomarinicola tropica TaxID=2789776 RepID=A0A5Q2RBT7_9ACTN|nr:serine hydrolase domain-containing protein [Actinomarinicola tropica]QGG94298.1 serine hydrolase [Actinomarinicola tropica]
MAPITGHCDPRFAAVEEAFRANFDERGEVGAAVCVRLRGETVVDLAGGWADAAFRTPWTLDTVVDVYSVGKAVIGTLALQLVDEGLLDLDAPLGEVWPELAAGGTERATLRHALSHRAGLPAIAEPLTDDDLWDWDRMCAALAATPAWFAPGSRHVYHVNTYGHLLGEVVRRATGATPSERLAAVTEPLGLDLWFGVPDHALDRCADVLWASPSGGPRPDPETLDHESRMNLLAHFNPPGYSSIGVVNSPQWRAAVVPSTNSHASARAIAGLYAALLEPGRVLSGEVLAEATTPQSVGPCPILGEDVSFGLGFQPTTARRPLGPNPRSFGHFGSGGALGYADPDSGVAFGYVMNHLIPRWQSSRNRALIDALHGCLA